MSTDKPAHKKSLHPVNEVSMSNCGTVSKTYIPLGKGYPNIQVNKHTRKQRTTTNQ